MKVNLNLMLCFVFVVMNVMRNILRECKRKMNEKILHLTLIKKWFDLITAGKKKVEYIFSNSNGCVKCMFDFMSYFRVLFTVCFSVL